MAKTEQSLHEQVEAILAEGRSRGLIVNDGSGGLLKVGGDSGTERKAVACDQRGGDNRRRLEVVKS